MSIGRVVYITTCDGFQRHVDVYFLLTRYFRRDLPPLNFLQIWVESVTQTTASVIMFPSFSPIEAPPRAGIRIRTTTASADFSFGAGARCRSASVSPVSPPSAASSTAGFSQKLPDWIEGQTSFRLSPQSKKFDTCPGRPANRIFLMAVRANGSCRLSHTIPGWAPRYVAWDSVPKYTFVPLVDVLAPATALAGDFCDSLKAIVAQAPSFAALEEGE